MEYMTSELTMHADRLVVMINSSTLLTARRRRGNGYCYVCWCLLKQCFLMLYTEWNVYKFEFLVHVILRETSYITSN